jgi:hypothetical protein
VLHEQTIVNQKVLGSATEGVPLNMLKTSICSAYTGPKSFYPGECVKLVGEQQQFAPEEIVVDKGDKPLAVAGEKSQATAAPVKEAVNTGIQAPASGDVVEGEGGDIVVDMKEEEATPAAANVATTAAATGKVRLDMYWRAFWYVARHTIFVHYLLETETDRLLRVALAVCRSSRDLSSHSFETRSTFGAASDNDPEWSNSPWARVSLYQVSGDHRLPTSPRSWHLFRREGQLRVHGWDGGVPGPQVAELCRGGVPPNWRAGGADCCESPDSLILSDFLVADL